MDQKMVTSDHCLRNQRMTHPWGHCLHLGRETGHRVPSRRSESLRTLDHRFFRHATQRWGTGHNLWAHFRNTPDNLPISSNFQSPAFRWWHHKACSCASDISWSTHPLILDPACYIQVRIQHQKVDVGSTSRIVQHANAFDQTCHPRCNQQVKRQQTFNGLKLTRKMHIQCIFFKMPKLL